ncbi:hypothetical protein [Acrocarpospora sp. B8E8]
MSPIEEVYARIDQQSEVILRDLAELKAGQIEIRDLLTRVVARLEGVQ